MMRNDKMKKCMFSRVLRKLANTWKRWGIALITIFLGLFSGIFIVVGIVIFIDGLFLIKDTFNYDDTIDTKGIITHISSHKSYYASKPHLIHDIYVPYNVQNEKLESILNTYYHSDFYEGKEIDIYYHKNNPS